MLSEILQWKEQELLPYFHLVTCLPTFICKLDQSRFKSCKYVMIVSYHGCYIRTSYVLYEPATTYVYNEWYMHVIYTQ